MRAPILATLLLAAVAAGAEPPLAELRKDAEQGETAAQVVLGHMYATGVGLPRDDEEAVWWFHKAAGNSEVLRRYAVQDDDSTARFILGRLYDYGRTWDTGMPGDIVLAYAWYTLAAERAHELAVERKDELASSMTPEQIAEAERKARELAVDMPDWP